MSVLQSLHVGSLHRFLTAIQKHRDVWICDAGCDSRVLTRVHLNGKEQRPFTQAEIDKILEDYEGLRGFFERKGLWPKRSS
jgi:hypothetical protein